MSINRLAPVAIALALLSVAGCAQSTSTAARVDGTTITTKDVDLVSRALCRERETAPASAGATTISISQIHSQALAVLIEAVLDEKFAAKEDIPYNKQALAEQVAGVNPLISKLKKADQEPMREVITRLFRGQLQVQGLGAASLAQKGTQPSPQQAETAGQALRAKFDKSVDITVNPRYSVVGPGKTGPGASSVSHPVSAFAKDATSSKSQAEFAASLPENQTCG